MPAAIQVHNLVKKYGEVEALKSVSLEVEPGECFGLLGPNGAGKTSLISILTTLEAATSGSVSLFGEEVGVGKREAKRVVGCVPQETVSHGFFGVAEILRFHSGYYGIRNNEDHIQFLLDRVGLKEHQDKRVRQLSGGMKRRLLIAKALVHKPKLLLLDEPTAGVDVGLRTTLWEFVRELNAQGVTILLTTHYLEEAEELCKRVGVLHKGSLLSIGETSSLIQRLTSREITFLLSSPIEKVSHPYLHKQTTDSLVFKVPSQINLVDLMKELQIPVDKFRDMRTREGTLEEAFKHLIGESHV